MSRREHGGNKPASSAELLLQEADVYLSPAVEHQLAYIMEQRERIESALQRMDVEIYDLETDFLKHCVSFGGSLFDGFGLERRFNAHRNPVAVLTPLLSSQTGGGNASALGGFETGSASGSLPGPPLLTNTAKREQLRTYQYLTNSSQGSSSGGADASMGSASPAVFQVGSRGATAPAFHYRIHFFSPSERVFSACSVGALSRVEVAKSIVDSANGMAKTVARSTVAAGSSAGRGQGGGKRGRYSSNGSVTAAFAREPDAPPSRRRQRDASDEGDDGTDATAQDSDLGRRRRRHTE
ncbi:hypothetical protein ABL78_2287 [Leptomonas seymouri]|uniref:Chromatin modification-related protein EAF6 n=1 Tax=Leptomonas seymouri TaxID=5684 RepID=A0A0N0P7C1_LEPSE|nr:hypothetical protein ABL78_2287 [Leptomonas seymouri]|eukprot:KPI88619.1 hypothetical protein ABL78_2287 [Leptomonas seymouri]